MTDLEEKIRITFEEKTDMVEVHRHFFIWEYGKESLKKFLNKLNSFHPTIKFIAEYSKETIDFLDVNIRLVEGKLMTDMFVKRTNSYQFLDLSSSHPYYCKNTIELSSESQ